jgi:hypothetical protein
VLNIRKLGGVTADDVLAKVGLQQRESALAQIIPAATLLGVGILIGVGVGLMLAPRSGRELRGDLRRRLHGKTGAAAAAPDAGEEPEGQQPGNHQKRPDVP